MVQRWPGCYIPYIPEKKSIIIVYYYCVKRIELTGNCNGEKSNILEILRCNSCFTKFIFF